MDIMISDEYKYQLNSKSEVKLVEYIGNSKLVEVPQIIDGYVVREINDRCFKECENIIQITFSGKIDKIGKEAFYGCSDLRYIKLPAGIKTIEASMFKECDLLTTIVIPESVVDIEKETFEKDKELLIYSTTNSYAHQYAEANDFIFKAYIFREPELPLVTVNPELAETQTFVSIKPSISESIDTDELIEEINEIKDYSDNENYKNIGDVNKDTL